MKKPRFTPTERRAKTWIARRLGLASGGLTDRVMCERICVETGWPAPSKQARKPLMARYWAQISGEAPRVAAPIIRRPKPARRPRPSVGFYHSDEWRQLRYQVLKKFGAACQCCGASAKDGKVMHVDHIKPRSKYRELELVFSNLQVLCEDCNLGKLHLDETDWRPSEAELLPEGATEHLRSLN